MEYRFLLMLYGPCGTLLAGEPTCVSIANFCHDLCKHYGFLELNITDHGSRFLRKFAESLGAHGVIHHTIDGQSPWQNGKTERVGGVFKEQLTKVIHDRSITTIEQFRTAIAKCVSARNRYRNRSVFSPHQRVFGSSWRMPGSLV